MASSFVHILGRFGDDGVLPGHAGVVQEDTAVSVGALAVEDERLAGHATIFLKAGNATAIEADSARIDHRGVVVEVASRR